DENAEGAPLGNSEHWEHFEELFPMAQMEIQLRLSREREAKEAAEKLQIQTAAEDAMANLLASSIGAMALQKAVAEDTLAAARAETAALQARLEASDVAELETALSKAEAEVQEAQRGWQTARNALGQSEYVRARLTERLKRCKQTIVTLNDRLFEGGRERRAARLRVDMAEGKLEVALSDATHARDVAASHRAQRSQAQMETRWALEEAGEARLQAEEARKAAAAATADAAQARAQAAQAERVASEATAKADGLAKDLDRTETEVAAARRELDHRIQSSFSIPAKKAISLAVKGRPWDATFYF
ncbi:hypothetical protein APUTEX25_004168, partial [Auxenochlorella protothecoides]